MVDRAELRRLAEACLAHLDSGPLWVEWEENGPGPVEFLELLEEIERLKGECDFFSARSEEERTNRGLAEKDFHDAMELVRKYSAERDKLRAALEAIAAHNPAVTHGGAEQVREMARRALADPEVEKL